MSTLFSPAFPWDEIRDLRSKTILLSIMAASMCCCLANTFPEVCAAFGNEMLPLFGEYWKTRWRFVNFSHLTLRVSQPFLESFDKVVVGNVAELVELLTLIHRYIG